MSATSPRQMDIAWLTLKTGLLLSSIVWLTLLLGLLFSSKAMALPTIRIQPRLNLQRISGTVSNSRPTIQGVVVNSQRAQLIRHLSSHLGDAVAQELVRHLPPSVSQKIGQGLDRVQATPEGRQLKGLLRQSVSLLSRARQQAKTRPTEIAVARQINGLGLVTSKLLEEGLQTRRDRLSGSERGKIDRFIIESPQSNYGFLLLQGKHMGQVHVANGPRAASIRLTPTTVARTLNNDGTKEIVEQTSGKHTYYLEKEFTMAPGREKPIHVTIYKSKVDRAGKIIPIQPLPGSGLKEITRVMVEDRDIP